MLYKDNDNWWFGRLNNGQQGYFLASYVADQSKWIIKSCGRHLMSYMYIKRPSEVQDAQLFYLAGDFSDEVTQSAAAHTALSEGAAERSTPTRVRRQNRMWAKRSRRVWL